MAHRVKHNHTDAAGAMAGTCPEAAGRRPSAWNTILLAAAAVVSCRSVAVVPTAAPRRRAASHYDWPPPPGGGAAAIAVMAPPRLAAVGCRRCAAEPRAVQERCELDQVTVKHSSHLCV